MTDYTDELCPRIGCTAKGVARERCLDGDTICAAGHPSKSMEWDTRERLEVAVTSRNELLAAIEEYAGGHDLVPRLDAAIKKAKGERTA